MTHKHPEHTEVTPKQENTDLNHPDHAEVPVKDITDQSTLPSPLAEHEAEQRGEEERQEKQKVEDILPDA